MVVDEKSSDHGGEVPSVFTGHGGKTGRKQNEVNDTEEPEATGTFVRKPRRHQPHHVITAPRSPSIYFHLHQHGARRLNQSDAGRTGAHGGSEAKRQIIFVNPRTGEVLQHSTRAFSFEND